MTLLFLVGDHPRNLYIAKKLVETGIDLAIVLEKRNLMVPTPAKHFSDHDRSLWDLHFQKRANAELRHFGHVDWESIPSLSELEIPVRGLNGGALASFIAGKKFSGTFCFGISLIRDALLRELPPPVVNLHSGLTPHYMGDASNFWANYFFQPNHAGATFHHVDLGIDTGPVVHQVSPTLERADGVHDVACKAIVRAGDDLEAVIENALSNSPLRGVAKTGGRHFYQKDFMPAHLDVLYNFLQDRVVDSFLDGAIRPPSPEIITVK